MEGADGIFHVAAELERKPINVSCVAQNKLNSSYRPLIVKDISACRLNVQIHLRSGAIVADAKNALARIRSLQNIAEIRLV